jgi:hypothetical protein
MPLSNRSRTKLHDEIDSRRGRLIEQICFIPNLKLRENLMLTLMVFHSDTSEVWQNWIPTRSDLADTHSKGSGLP